MRQFIVFILVLVGLNAIFALLNIPLHFSIIGSIVASALVSGIMYLIYRPRQ